jgi:hypothetical protein
VVASATVNEIALTDDTNQFSTDIDDGSGIDPSVYQQFRNLGNRRIR